MTSGSIEAALAPGITIEGARRRISLALRDRGVDSPDLDARLLVGHALGADHAALASAARRVLSGAEIAALLPLVQRRLAREPVARILGCKEFWGMTFALSPSTLVPRPETETVVEAALAAMGAPDRRPRIADLGTGSGCLLLALLRERPAATGFGTDRSLAALCTARDNARRHGLAARAHFVECDFADALRGPFDCIVSNPPYIPSNKIGTLAPEVRDFDPGLALDGGPDGLSAYRRIASDARRLLTADGALVLELGMGQEEAVTAIMAGGGLHAESPARRDLGGIARALTLRLSP
ncbi:MAG TPA: peptide chain release factor N(5)-glutamine methyltransferase [Pseudorhodoplanes sp.]|nr:peptide chain release factor N(5)-glutamine methyltransferase [Pseudorhodoplanes sp.]